MKTSNEAAGADAPVAGAELVAAMPEVAPLSTENAQAGGDTPPAEIHLTEPIPMKKSTDAPEADTAFLIGSSLTAREALSAWRNGFVRDTAYAENLACRHAIQTGMEIIHHGLLLVDGVPGYEPGADIAPTSGSVQVPGDDTAPAALAAWVDAYVRNTAYGRHTEAWNRIHSGIEMIHGALTKVDATQSEGK